MGETNGTEIKEHMNILSRYLFEIREPTQDVFFKNGLEIKTLTVVRYPIFILDKDTNQYVDARSYAHIIAELHDGTTCHSARGDFSPNRFYTYSADAETGELTLTVHLRDRSIVEFVTEE